MKKQSHLITTLIPEIISRFKKTLYKDYDSYLSYLGELGGINSKWIINELSLIKQKLGRELWKEQRSAALTIGSIGAVDISLIEEVISMMIEYIANFDDVPKELQELVKRCDFPIDIKISTSNKIDFDIWVRDAYIDAIVLIGKTYPESVKTAIPLLKYLSKYSTSHYTNKKAKKTLEEVERQQ